MKYKTKRQYYIKDAIIMLCLDIGLAAYVYTNREYYPIIMAVCILLVGIFFLIYCMLYDAKRKYYKLHGECIPGNIIGVDLQVGGRGGGSYHLKISFSDNGEKVLFTEAYIDDPNERLKSRNCKIYKWKGKYIEGDFEILDKGESPQNLDIPIHGRVMVSAGEIGKISENSPNIWQQLMQKYDIEDDGGNE